MARRRPPPHRVYPRASHADDAPGAVHPVGGVVVEPHPAGGQVPEPVLAGRQGDRDAAGAVAPGSELVAAGCPVVEGTHDADRALRGLHRKTEGDPRLGTEQPGPPDHDRPPRELCRQSQLGPARPAIPAATRANREPGRSPARTSGSEHWQINDGFGGNTVHRLLRTVTAGAAAALRAALTARPAHRAPPAPPVTVDIQ